MHRVMSWLMLSVTALKHGHFMKLHWLEISPYNQTMSHELKDGFMLGHIILRSCCVISIPGGSSQQVLGVGCCRVNRQALRCQQQLAGGHGDVLQAPDDLHLVIFFLKAHQHNVVTDRVCELSS